MRTHCLGEVKIFKGGEIRIMLTLEDLDLEHFADALSRGSQDFESGEIRIMYASRSGFGTFCGRTVSGKSKFLRVDKFG